jgi:hypothetical protein
LFKNAEASISLDYKGHENVLPKVSGVRLDLEMTTSLTPPNTLAKKPPNNAPVSSDFAIMRGVCLHESLRWIIMHDVHGKRCERQESAPIAVRRWVEGQSARCVNTMKRFKTSACRSEWIARPKNGAVQHELALPPRTTSPQETHAACSFGRKSLGL